MYNYTPLHTSVHSIRLAILLPGSKDDEIELGLIKTPLLLAPPYEALSYAWGTPNYSRTASVMGQKIFLSSTLEIALRNLRHESEKRTMWIDAVCINQADIEERNSQVGFMGEVYSQAEKVIVWLGTQDQTSDKAMDFLREMGRNPVWWRRWNWNKHSRKNEDGKLKEDDRRISEEMISEEEEEVMREKNKYNESMRKMKNLFRAGLEDKSRRPKFSKDDNGTKTFHIMAGYWTDCCGDAYCTRLPFFHNRDSDWEALDELLLRPWFSRVWVLQEVWKASKAVLQCGSKTISWNSFAIAMSYDESWDEMGEAIIGTSRKAKWNSLKRRYGLAIHMSNKSLMGSTLSDLLWNTWDRECSDPRDKVFAVMGLVGENHGESLGIDYGIGIHQLFKEVAYHIITAQRSLDILLAASGPTDTGNIPSWVPDWRSEANSQRPILFVNRKKLHSIYHGGSMVGTVVMRGHGFRASGSFPAVFSFSEKLDVLRVSCVMMDTIAVLDKAYPEEKVHLAIYTACSLASSRELSRQVTNIHENVKMVLAAGGTGSSRDEEDPTDDIITNVMKNRRFFITQKGHMCVGPVHSKKGDIVCIVAGCNFPIILRKDGEHYLLVGEAYVHNMMAGEAVEGDVGWENVDIY